MNESTYRFLTATVGRWASRISLRGKKTRLFCRECSGLRIACDYYHGPKAVILDCGHRRPVALRTQQDIAAFEQAKTDHGTHQRSQKNPRISEFTSKKAA
jgi:hypothetical protein